MSADHDEVAGLSSLIAPDAALGVTTTGKL